MDGCSGHTWCQLSIGAHVQRQALLQTGAITKPTRTPGQASSRRGAVEFKTRDDPLVEAGFFEAHLGAGTGSRGDRPRERKASVPAFAGAVRGAQLMKQTNSGSKLFIIEL